ncbi:MAG: hypothetical protein JWP51_2872 [Bradyrhizobium sp.]|jgi:hypothetical protein|nr:hypothetical protein [Bradyrhizobium sp.]
MTYLPWDEIRACVLDSGSTARFADMNRAMQAGATVEQGLENTE